MIIMVNETNLNKHILKLLVGLIIYFAIINISLFNQYNSLFTPREWLLNPLHNLFVQPNLAAWIILVICEIVGWNFFEPKR